MNRKLFMKLKMYLTVLAFLKKNIIIWGSLVAFKTGVDSLEAGIQIIKDKDKLDKKTNPETKGKLQLRETMLDDTEIVCNSGIAYASFIKDDKLKAKFNFSRHDLIEGNEETVYNRCTTIALAAEPIADILTTKYNMPVDQLTTLVTDATAYNDDLTTNREKRTGGKTVNKDMKKEYKDMDTLLDERLDSLVFTYKKAQPEFYNGYQDARYIGGWSADAVLPPVPPSV